MKYKKKLSLISLGCAKNQVDSENLLGLLREKGFAIIPAMAEADIAVINTCGFIQAAVEETIDTILEIAALKKEGQLKKLVVTGCFVQRYGYSLRKEIPEVDGWFGTGQFESVLDFLLNDNQPQQPVMIKKPNYLADHTTPRLQTTPFFSAYLKIAEGCSNKCSYCIIPKLTGPYRSRKLESLLIEARKMADQGVRELNLVAQDTTYYGYDLKNETCLETLLERLRIIPGLDWIRILYAHPNRISDRLLALLNTESKIVPYLDMPLQHIHQAILQKMGRSFRPDTPRQLIQKIRSLAPKISLRTTFMIGFPGETDQMFAELLDFIRETEFDHLGAFIYSPEKGTAAARLKDSVDKKTARKRLMTVMRVQAGISKRKNRKLIGSTIPVLIEGQSPETDLLLTGRTAAMAPDVDGRVLINKGCGEIGTILPVLITEVHAYDLIGEILEN